MIMGRLYRIVGQIKRNTAARINLYDKIILNITE
ncbi:hypothetical protein IMSAG049_00702 [Clostridiales bacterium]|nr:hypothetical protein IMSAG049_00702 [Clostridiales bacterium]